MQQQPTNVQDVLAQRGLVTQSGHLRYPSANKTDTASVSQASPSAANPQDALAANADAVGAGGSGSGTSSPVASAAPTISPQQADVFAQFEQQSPNGDATGPIGALEAIGAVAAGTAAAYALWRRSRQSAPAEAVAGAGAGASPNTANALAGARTAPADDGIIDAEFTEVNEPRLPPPAAAPDSPANVVEADKAPTRAPDIVREQSLEIARRHRDSAQSPGVREYWDQVIRRIESDIGAGNSNTADTAPTGQSKPKPQSTVAGQLEQNQRRTSARNVLGRTRAEPNDVAPIHAPDMATHYSEEDIRQANALADELIAQRLRGQRLRRNGGARRAGPPSAPINPLRPNEGVTEARPALVNEILRQIIEARNPTGRILRRGIH